MAKSPLLLKEDYWSIWIGGFLLLLGIMLFFTNAPQQLDQKLEEQQEVIQQEEARAPFLTVAWHQTVDAQR